MTSNVQKHLSVLGYPVRDRVTGFAGIATSVSFDLYGCVQVIVHPGLQADGKLGEQTWFDLNRLELTSVTPVMEQPDFVDGRVAEGNKGPENKPAMKA